MRAGRVVVNVLVGCVCFVCLFVCSYGRDNLAKVAIFMRRESGKYRALACAVLYCAELYCIVLCCVVLLTSFSCLDLSS
jgi:hypothetical protein